MNTKLVTCAMCGHTFDPDEQAACPACPLHKGCTMICCPVCGYSTINPNRSQLVRLVSLLMPEETKHESRTD